MYAQLKKLNGSPVMNNNNNNTHISRVITREATPGAPSPGAPSPGAQDSWPPEFSPGDKQETPGPRVHR